MARKPNLEKYKKILELIEKGNSHRDIQKELGVSPNTIQNAVDWNKNNNKDNDNNNDNDNNIVEKQAQTTKERNIKKKDNDNDNDNNNDKTKEDLLIEYILAVNHGHKAYEKYGFDNNHEFIAKINKMVYNLKNDN